MIVSVWPHRIAVMSLPVAVSRSRMRLHQMSVHKTAVAEGTHKQDEDRQALQRRSVLPSSCRVLWRLRSRADSC